MLNKQKPGEGLLCDCETSRRFVFPALLLIPHFTPAASNWTRGVLQCPLAQCTEGPGKWMGVKSWCVMKITLSSAKYILQMTERVLHLQQGMVGDGTGDTAWVGSSLLVPFYTRLTWFYFAFFGEAFNHFVKCFSPDYLWALGHGLHLRMDFAVMFSVELFHCSAAVLAMKVVWPLQTARVTFTSRATINATYLVRRVDSLRPRKYFYKQLFIFHPSQGAGVGPVNVWIEPIRGDSASA